MKAALACLLVCCCSLPLCQATNVTATLPHQQPASLSPRCETGEFSASPNTNGAMYNPEYQEKRDYVSILFKQSFYSLPWVSVSFSSLDVDRSENMRVHVITTNVGLHGFTAYVNQWSGAVVHLAKVSWIACDL